MNRRVAFQGASTARPEGAATPAAPAAPPSPLVAQAPVPASVAMVPASRPMEVSTQRTRHAVMSATHTRLPFNTATPRPAASVALTLGPPSPLATPVLRPVRDATEGSERFAKRRRLPAPSVKKKPLPVASAAKPYGACTFCAVSGAPLASAVLPDEVPEPNTVPTTPLVRLIARIRFTPLSPTKRASPEAESARDSGAFAAASHAGPLSPAKATTPVPSSVHAVPGALVRHSGYATGEGLGVMVADGVGLGEALTVGDAVRVGTPVASAATKKGAPKPWPGDIPCVALQAVALQPVVYHEEPCPRARARKGSAPKLAAGGVASLYMVSVCDVEGEVSTSAYAEEAVGAPAWGMSNAQADTSMEMKATVVVTAPSVAHVAMGAPPVGIFSVASAAHNAAEMVAVEEAFPA
jgi:hypothetical protein